jgi:hypothetical protein
LLFRLLQGFWERFNNLAPKALATPKNLVFFAIINLQKKNQINKKRKCQHKKKQTHGKQQQGQGPFWASASSTSSRPTASISARV